MSSRPSPSQSNTAQPPPSNPGRKWDPTGPGSCTKSSPTSAVTSTNQGAGAGRGAGAGGDGRHASPRKDAGAGRVTPTGHSRYMIASALRTIRNPDDRKTTSGLFLFSCIPYFLIQRSEDDLEPRHESVLVAMKAR